MVINGLLVILMLLRGYVLVVEGVFVVCVGLCVNVVRIMIIVVVRRGSLCEMFMLFWIWMSGMVELG